MKRAARSMSSIIAVGVVSSALMSGCSEDQDAESGPRAGDAGTDRTMDALPDRASDAARERADDHVVGDGQAGVDAKGAPTDGPPDADGPAVSRYCGDGIRDPILEECDDGNKDESDSCSSDCRIRFAPFDPPQLGDGGRQNPGIQRRYGEAPHVSSANDGGFAIVYCDPDPASTRLWLAPFTPSGARQGDPIDVGSGEEPAGVANPAVAALADGRYAVAWTDRASGSSDILVRVVDGVHRSVGRAKLAHEDTIGPQELADVLWTGSELIVAWTTFVDTYYRKFQVDGTDLTAQDKEQPLAASPTAYEAKVALAPFAGGWAGIVRSADESGAQVLSVKAGGGTWTTSAEAVRASGDAPGLVSLDETHYLLVFSAQMPSDGTDPVSGRLRTAILDTTAPGTVETFDFAELSSYGSDPFSYQQRPSAARVGDKVYVAWEASTEPPRSDPFVAIATVDFDPARPKRVTAHPISEYPKARGHEGPQTNPRIAASPLAPSGAVIIVWETAGAGSGSPLAVEVRPSPFVFSHY